MKLTDLEKLVDRNELSCVLESLSDVCYEKAIHVDEAWHDRHLSNEWAQAGERIWKVARRFYDI
jgi:hypothetical protein